MFENNTDITFVDIDLSQSSPTLKGSAVGNPGSDGWPSMRYFTKETGLFGAPYNKLTNLPICQELGEIHRMINYVEDYGKTVLCGLDGRHCTDKELKYLGKWKDKSIEEVEKQLSRLEEMTMKKMKDDLYEWAIRRIRILKKVIQGYTAVSENSKGPSMETDEL